MGAPQAERTTPFTRSSSRTSQFGHSSKMADTLNIPVLNQYRARRVLEYEGDVPDEEVWNVHKSRTNDNRRKL